MTEIDNSGRRPFLKKITYSQWFFIIIGVSFAIIYLINSGYRTEEISWETFSRDMLLHKDVAKVNVVNNEEVEVFIKDDSLNKQQYSEFSRKAGKLIPGPHYVFKIGSIETFERRLDAAQADFSDGEKIKVSYTKSREFPVFWLIAIGFILFWYFSASRMLGTSGAGKTAMDFGKSRAKEYQKGRLSQITFREVAGYEEAKMEVMEIVEFLKKPENFTKIGAKIPKGILLVGPPGTGKTLMAKAVAGEAAVPFFSLSGSEFIELFVGVGASRVRDLFEKAKEKAPSIIFIDEIDTIGRIRGKAISIQVNDERESTLNQLLAEMDGFEANTGVIVIAATNRADILDPALLRAGRFDRHVYLELPNRNERTAIFNVHLKKLTLEDGIDSEFLSAQTPGFSGADIANACNEAALIAARQKKQAVGAKEFSDAIDRIIGGIEKKTRVITPSEKNTIAYHEAGHVVVSWMLPHIDPLSKVSIIPRGKSLGGAWYLPEEKQIITRAKFKEQLSAALAGRAAEDIIFNEISSGALDDLEKATKLAYSMTVKLGLSEKIGNLSFYDSTGTYDSAFQKPYSEATAELIDDEVRQFIGEAYDKAKDILKANHEKLCKLAGQLLEKEILYKDEIELILGRRNEMERPLPATV